MWLNGHLYLYSTHRLGGGSRQEFVLVVLFRTFGLVFFVFFCWHTTLAYISIVTNAQFYSKNNDFTFRGCMMSEAADKKFTFLGLLISSFTLSLATAETMDNICHTHMHTQCTHTCIHTRTYTHTHKWNAQTQHTRHLIKDSPFHILPLCSGKRVWLARLERRYRV